MSGEARWARRCWRRSSRAGGGGEWSFEPGGALPGLMPADRRSGRSALDQSNTSLVVGERLV